MTDSWFPLSKRTGAGRFLVRQSNHAMYRGAGNPFLGTGRVL